MTILQKLLEEEENIVFYNQDSFLDKLVCCKYNDTMSSGKTITDSCTMNDYLKWKETL